MSIGRILSIILIALSAAVIVPNFHTSWHRARQKETMALIRDVADRIDRGAVVTAANDAWKHPLRIRRSGRRSDSANQRPVRSIPISEAAVPATRTARGTR